MYREFAEIVSRKVFLVLALACIVSGMAQAQAIDDIVLAPAEGGAVVARIKLNATVQYLRHAPPGKGQMLEIYYRVLVSAAPRDAWPDEIRRSPPSDLIPSFTVTAQNRNASEQKLVLQFSRPVAFDVRVGNKARSFEITIRPLPSADTLDLGEIRLKSALGEPLDAEIELPGAGRGDAAGLSARMASPEMFKALGVDYSDKLPLLQFRIETRAGGEPYVKVTSAAAIQEPLIRLLVQLSGPTGKLTREYTLLPALAVPKEQPAVAQAKPVPARGEAPLARTAGQKSAAPAASRPQKIAEAAVHPDPLPDSVSSVASAIPSGSVAPAEPAEDINKQAEALMGKGRAAMQRGDHGIAIEAFNKLLALPPNPFTQDAQEWVGMARESAGQNFKAKLEYELYLKTYSSGNGVARVRARLAGLSAAQPVKVAEKPASAAAAAPVVAGKKETQTMQYGSLSMYYYHGASQTDIPATGASGQPLSLSTVDQSLLLTNANATLRVRNDVYDNRLVFQDAYSRNFLPGRASSNKLNSLYFDVRNRVANYSARIGRQASSGGGVMGRFDGATAGFGFAPKWHVNGVAGRMAEFAAASRPSFYGASLDMGVFDEHWNGSLYAIKQTVDGVTDRKATGAEVRYFGAGGTMFAMLDYDTSFSAVNIALLQGTLNGSHGTTWNFLLDQRKTPSLGIRNALNGATVTSVNELLQNGWLEADIRDLAKARTATTTTMQLGVGRQVRENLQVNGDLSLSRTSALPASGTLLPGGTTGIEGFQAATADTGVSRTFSGQLVGSNVYSRHDVTVFSMSFTRSPSLQGQTYLISSRAVVREKWTLDGGLRLYWQKDNSGGRENIVSPTVKLSYRAGNRLSLEGEAGYEVTNNAPGGGATVHTARKFFSVGGHADF